MNKNLVTEDLSGKPGIKFAFESGKLVLSCNGVFVGKGYFTEGMIKLYTSNNVSIDNKSVFCLYC